MKPLEPHRFPVYRILANGRSCYRIESETSFTEVQLIGSRYIAHQVTALIWPERLRIADLLANADGSLEPMAAEDFDRWLALADSGPG